MTLLDCVYYDVLPLKTEAMEVNQRLRDLETAKIRWVRQHLGGESLQYEKDKYTRKPHNPMLMYSIRFERNIHAFLPIVVVGAVVVDNMTDKILTVQNVYCNYAPPSKKPNKDGNPLLTRPIYDLLENIYEKTVFLKYRFENRTPYKTKAEVIAMQAAAAANKAAKAAAAAARMRNAWTFPPYNKTGRIKR
jgi:hypothetical protein